MSNEPSSIGERLAAFAADFDGRLRDALTPAGETLPELCDAVTYAALGPGKRLRPYLVVRSCELAGGSPDHALAAAAAVECIHAFSLIHDDLPAMDNDDLRRGRPTCHRRFSEATAILAGDALAVLAFELLARGATPPSITVQLVNELARAAGWSGMIGGQAADIAGESQSPSLDQVEFIQARKTASLFSAACRMGALVAGAGPEVLQALASYGFAFGEAFQIIDDLLDVTGTAAALGKSVGKDLGHGKQTFSRCVGVDAARRRASEAAARAKIALSGFGPEAEDLRSLTDYALSRNY